MLTGSIHSLEWTSHTLPHPLPHDSGCGFLVLFTAAMNRESHMSAQFVIESSFGQNQQKSPLISI